jgi:hypothetical protein
MRREPFVGGLVVKAALKYYCRADSAERLKRRRRAADGFLVCLIFRFSWARSQRDIDTHDVGLVDPRLLVRSAASESRPSRRPVPAIPSGAL